jgi:hypothetical protein
MTRPVKRVFYALLLLFSSTAMAELADQGSQSSCSRYGVRAVGMPADQPVDQTNPGGKVGRPPGAQAPSDCGNANLAMPDSDTLLGGPRDYDDRYGTSTDSVLESNLTDLDASSPSPSASRPAGALKPRQSKKSTIAISASSSFAVPAVSTDVYRSPW